MLGLKVTSWRWLPWVHRGGFAVLDQALFAGANFALNILLARWLPPEEYGAFAVAYSVFLLLSTIHTAVLTEPMLVFGAGKYGDRFSSYVGLLVFGHWWITSAISLLLVLAAILCWYVGPDDLAWALLALALAAPLILLMWLVRRAFYVYDLPQWAATGGALYLVLMLVGVYGLYQLQWLSPAVVLVVMSGVALMVSLWLWTLLCSQRRLTATQPTAWMVLADHWEYGRWSMATAAAVWVPTTVYYALLPAWAGLEGSAALRALMNLVMPMLHINSAMSVVLLPSFVKTRVDRGPIAFSRLLRLTLSYFTMTSLGYWGLLIMLRTEMFLWVYDGRYTEYAGLLALSGLQLLPAAAAVVLETALRAMERPDLIFWSYVVSGSVGLALGLWLISTHGVAGAVVGLLLSSVVGSVMLLGLYRGTWSQSSAENL